jgi:hypothetical protein
MEVRMWSHVDAMVDSSWHPIAYAQLQRQQRGQALTHRLVALPGVSRGSRRLLGPLQGIIDGG